MKQYTRLISIAVIVLAVLIIVLAQQKPITLQKADYSQHMAPIVKSPIPNPEKTLNNQTINHTEITKVPEQKTIKLAPDIMTFNVNRYPIPQTQPMQYIPIAKDKIKLITGSFGPYTESVRQYIKVILCSSETDGTYPACEQIVPTYRGGMMEFAQGYNVNEYIAGVARKQFLAWYELHTNDGMIAKSNIASIEIS